MKKWERWESDWTQYQIDQIWTRKVEEKEWRFNPRYKIPAEFAHKYAKSVLDIGCGGGIHYKAISELDKSIYYRGIDITPKMINTARGLFPGVIFEAKDATNLSYADNAFDLCVVSHVLEHHPLEGGRQILSEAMRIARLAVILVFFIPPIYLESGNIKTKIANEFYVNTYDRNWLISTIYSIDGDCEIEIKKCKWQDDDNAFYIITKR